MGKERKIELFECPMFNCQRFFVSLSLLKRHTLYHVTIYGILELIILVIELCTGRSMSLHVCFMWHFIQARAHFEFSSEATS